MSCNAIQTTKLGITFVCGPKVDDVACAFCGAMAMLLCDWQVEKLTKVFACELKVGNWVHFRDRADGEVVYVGIPEEGFIAIGVNRGGRVYQVVLLALGEFLVRRTSTCDAAICADCGVERDAEHHLCPDHYRAWEQVA